MVQAAATIAKAAATTAAVGGAEALPATVNIATTAAPQILETSTQVASAATEAMGGWRKASRLELKQSKQ